MDLLYVASTEPQSGKTVLAAALGLLAQERGARPAYRRLGSATESQVAADVVFMATLLGDAANLAAMALGDRAEHAAEPGTPATTLTPDALRQLAPQADLLLLEGGTERAPDLETSAALGARVLLVAWYREQMAAREIQAAAEPYGDRLAGLLLNGVPVLRLHHVESHLLPALRAAGIPVLGALPQSRLLMAPTLADLVEFLGAEVIAFPEGLQGLLERVMVGALALDGGLYYYGQAERKVVITRWDRPDLQMPALETGCQGLILTGGRGPIPYVWNRVQELRVPVAVVPGGTIATASRLNDGFFAQRGRPHPRKAQEMASLVAPLPGLSSLLSSALAPR